MGKDVVEVCSCTCNSCTRPGGDHHGPGMLDQKYDEHQEHCHFL